MNRDTFMRELEYLLQDIPDEEKADALDYYRDYLEEAGEENEEAVIKEFGSPERIAAIIRSDITGDLKEGGEFTENGYQDERFKDPNFQISERYELPEVQEQPAGEQWERRKEVPRTNRLLKIILWAVLICVAVPAVLGIGGGILGAVSSCAAAALALVILVGLMTLLLFIGTVICGVAGIVLLFSSPVSGLLFLGVAILLTGLTLLSLVVSILFYGKFLPFLLRTVVDFLNRLFHRRSMR